MSDTKLRPEDLTSEERAIVDNAAEERAALGSYADEAHDEKGDAMSDTKLRPEDLTVEERAWCDRMAAALCSSGNYTAEGAIDEAVNFGLKKRRALFGQPKGESESCPNCGETTSRTHSRYAGPGPDKWTCQPAPPEPAATVDTTKTVAYCDELDARYGKPAAREMESARGAIAAAREYALELDHPESMEFHIRVDGFATGARYQRNLAQPVAVGMTEELRMILDVAESRAEDQRHDGLLECSRNLERAIAAVRQQAAQGRKVELGKARKMLEYMRRCAWHEETYQQIEEALAELDAAEKGEGRG